MADNALLTGYKPNHMTRSKTCIDVSSEYTPINIAVRRENFDIEDDFKFAVPEDSDLFTQPAVGSQRSVASTVPALMYVDSLCSTVKTSARVRADHRVVLKHRETSAMR